MLVSKTQVSFLNPYQKLYKEILLFFLLFINYTYFQISALQKKMNRLQQNLSQINMSPCGNMAMTFHFGFNEVVLFDAINVSNFLEMILVAVICSVIAFIHEGLKIAQKTLQRRLGHSYKAVADAGSNDSNDEDIDIKGLHRETFTRKQHLILSILYFVQTISSYTLMMIFMTFNLWLCGAVILGHVIGFFLFQLLDI